MTRVISIFPLLICLCFTSMADWKIVQIVSSPEDGKYEMVIYIQKNKIRTQSENFDVIFDLDQNYMIYINHDGKKYWEGSKDSFKQDMDAFMEKSMIEVMGQEGYEEYKNSIANISDIESEKGEIEIVADGAIEELAGFKGKKFKVFENGQLVEELWLCQEIQLMDEMDFTLLDQFFGQEREFDYSESEEYTNMLKENGFPIKDISYSYGELMEETVLKEVTELDLPASTFSAPKDYKKVEIMEVMNK